MEDFYTHLAACCSTCHQTQTAGQQMARNLAHLHLSYQDGSSSSSNIRYQHSAKGVDGASTFQENYHLFSFDIETTGLSPSADAIIEMAAVDVATGTSWGTLVKPEPYKRSSKHAFAAHGITESMLKQLDVPTFQSAWQQLVDFIQQQTPVNCKVLLVAHNGNTFDFRCLAHSLLRLHQQAQQQQQQQVQLQDLADGMHRLPDTSVSRSTAAPAVPAVPAAVLAGEAQGWLVLDSLHLLRSLKMLQTTPIANLQQATLVEFFTGAAPEVSHRARADAQQLANMLQPMLMWIAERAGSDVSSGLAERLSPAALQSFVAAAATAAASAAGTAASEADAAGGLASTTSRGSKSSCGNAQSVSWSPSLNGETGGGGKVCSSSAAAGSSACHMSVMQFGVRDGSSRSSGIQGNCGRSLTGSCCSQAEAISTCLDCPALQAAVAAAASTALEVGSSDDDDDDDDGDGGGGNGVRGFASPQPQWQSGSSKTPQIHLVRQAGAAAVESYAEVPARNSNRNGSPGGSSMPPQQADMLHVRVKGAAAPVITSAVFVQSMDTAIALPSSSSSSTAATPGLRLGGYVQGRGDPGSWFRDVVWCSGQQPVVFLMSGIKVAQELKLHTARGCSAVTAASLLVMAASQQQERHLQLVASAVDRLTALWIQQYQPQQQQQQRRRRLYSCMQGPHLQVRLLGNRSSGHLETVVRQLHQHSRGTSSNPTTTVTNVGAAMPAVSGIRHAADPGIAAEELRQLLPVGLGLNLVLWPSCVWSNDRYIGVTLSCVEVWLI